MHRLTELLVYPKHVLDFLKMTKKKKVQTMFLTIWGLGSDLYYLFHLCTHGYRWTSGCFIRPLEGKEPCLLSWFTLVCIA